MRFATLASGLSALLLAGSAASARPSPDPAAVLSSGRPTPADIAAHAPDSAWRSIDPADLLLLDLAGGGHVVIQLAPGFAPVHVANIRRLAEAHWFDNTSVNRVQDDYVVQWGDGSGKKPMPAGVVAKPPAEYERAVAGLRITRLASRDAYAKATGFADGWPVGLDPASGRVWLAHCYAMVGVGRDLPPDTGTGAELYAVIGQAPRQLDRNIALVGRVIDGLAALDTLPRGTASLGFYAEPEQRLGIPRVRLASDLPASERPNWQVMRTNSPSFAAYADARANRRDAFYIRPAGGADLCNIPVPIRSGPEHGGARP